MAAPARSTPFEFEWAPSPLPTATASSSSRSTTTELSPPLIAMVAVIGTAAIIVVYARLLHRRFRRWRRRRRLLLLLSDDSGSPPPNFSNSDDDDHYFSSPYYGLDDLSISSLPLSIYSSRLLEPSGKLRECAVCLLEFADGDRLRSLPLCSHHFHVGCIDVWLRSHATCPLCRSGVFVPMRASRIRPSLDDMILPDMSSAEPEISAASPAPPYRDFLLKRSYSFGFERDVSVSASATSPWRYRHGGRGFWSKRFPSPFAGGIGGGGGGGSRVFSFRAKKRRGFFALGGGTAVAATVGPSWRRSRAMTSPSAVFLRSVAAVGPAAAGFGSSRMRCGDPEALLSPERLGRR